MIGSHQAEIEIRKRLEIYDKLLANKLIIQGALNSYAECGNPVIEKQAQQALFELRAVW